MTEKQKALLKHLHMSVSDLADSMEKGATYSLTQEYENKAIRDFFNNSIAGGVIGCYFEEGFPIYFINDMMLAHLGFQTEKKSYRRLSRESLQCHPSSRQTYGCRFHSNAAAAKE